MEVQVQTGQRVTIFPDCAHRFEALEDAQVMEFYDTGYNSLEISHSTVCNVIPPHFPMNTRAETAK
jgi:hypothetical protein